MRKIIAACALAGLVLTPAAAVGGESETPDENARICRTEPPPIGTRLGARKVCATKKEWALLDAPKAETRMNIKRIQEVRSCGGNDCGPNRVSLGGRY